MRLPLRIVLTVMLGGCAAYPGPSLIWEGKGSARTDSASSAVARLVPASSGIRRGSWGDAEDATVQLLETAQAEDPHVHTRHDLTVVVLKGRGDVLVEGRQHPLRAGDVLQIGRGRVHALRPDGSLIGLAIFTPRLAEPDYVPANAMRHDAATAQ